MNKTGLDRNLKNLFLSAMISGAVLVLASFFFPSTVITVLLYLLLIAVCITGIWIRKEGKRERAETMIKLAEEQKKTVQAELDRKKQELLALQSQINPHFFYNTLDTLRGCAIEQGNYELSEMIAAISGMFKYSVNYNDEMVTLNSELNYLKKYIMIQKMRFPNRFEYEEKILCDTSILLDQPCPRFVLQPIVENALRHGLRDVTEGGLIRVTIDMTDHTVLITVEDNGCGMDAETLLMVNERLDHSERTAVKSESDGGIGMYNVNVRIRMLCGDSAGMYVASTQEEGTQVYIRLPREKQYHE